jgi:outer membrane cobalamin receptor
VRSLLPVLIGTLMACPVVPVWAQTAPPDLSRASLEDLLNIEVTTASRSPEGLATAPARVQVVTAAQIQRRGYRSLADLLKDLPDFKVDVAGDQDFPVELTVQGIRGTSHMVVLLDGVRVSSPTNEPLPILANYPVHLARQVEIVYGPASALYGADAFSGVINIISKDVVDAPGFAVGTSVGQFGLYNQTASYAGHLGSKATLLVAGQVLSDRQPDLSKYYPDDFHGLAGQHSGTFDTIFGPMTPTRPVSPDFEIPLSAHSLMATLRAGSFQAMFFESHARVSTTPAYNPDNAVYNSDAYNLNRLAVGAVSYTRPIGRVTSTSTLTLSRHELAPESGYWNVFSNFAKSYKYAYGSMVKGESQVSWKAAPTVTVTTGGTIERFNAIPQTADLNEPIRSRDQPGTILDTNIVDDFNTLHYTNSAAFGQMQYTASHAVTFTLGARVDHNSRYGTTFNPRVGAVMQPSSLTTLKLLYGSAFLAPSPYQTYAHYGSFYTTDGGQTYASSYWHLPNPDLKPERKKTVELNLRQAVGSRFFLTGSVFYSRLSNLIKGTDADQSYAGLYHGWPVDYIDFPVNEGRANAYGSTVGLDFLQVVGADTRIEAGAALTLVDGHVWEEDENAVGVPLGGMVPRQARFTADIDWHRWSVAPRLALVGEQRLLATTEDAGPPERRALDGYVTLDVNVRRRLLAKLDVFVTIENAFDRRYRAINLRAYTNPEELIGAPQNPRRVTVGFDLRLK